MRRKLYNNRVEKQIQYCQEVFMELVLLYALTVAQIKCMYVFTFIITKKSQ